MDMDGYGLIWIYGHIDTWIYGYMDISYMDIWTYGYMDIWIYGCICSMIGSNWGGEGRRPLPPRPALTRMFMRDQAPQIPHRFNGYTTSPSGFRG